MKVILIGFILTMGLASFAMDNYAQVNPPATKDVTLQATVSDPINNCEHCKFSQARLLDTTNPSTKQGAGAHSTSK